MQLGGERSRWLVVALTTLALGLVQVAPADAFVYWTNRNANTIGRANLDGSAVNQGFITGGSLTDGIAVDGAHVYWANEATGAIGRANLDGTGVNHAFITGASAPRGVAVDAAHIYWANTNSNRIGRANLDGTGVNQNFIVGPDTPLGVAVDGAHVYWTNLGSLQSIGRANLDGTGVSHIFIPGASTPSGVAVNGTHVYWTNQTRTNPSGPLGTIGRASLNGTSPNQDFIPGANQPIGIAVDGTHVYWANQGSGGIGRANLDGTSPNQSFITGAAVPFGVAVDAPPLAPPPAQPPPGGESPLTPIVTPPAAIVRDPFPENIETAATIDQLSEPEPFRETNVAHAEGDVFVKLPGGTGAARSAQTTPAGFIKLTQAAQVPLGSIIETTKGRAKLESSANRVGSSTQTADFYGGQFQVRQPRAARPITEMVLKGGSFRGCPRGRAKGSRYAASERAAESQRRRRSSRVRRVWGNGKGRFRARGRYSSATVRGTTWLTEDRCDGTLTRVARRPRTNRVDVRDLRARRTITLRAGQSYLARPRPLGKRTGR